MGEMVMAINRPKRRYDGVVSVLISHAPPEMWASRF